MTADRPTTTFDPGAYDRQSRDEISAMIEKELAQQREDADQEDETDPFAGIVDVEVNDGWDA